MKGMILFGSVVVNSIQPLNRDNDPVHQKVALFKTLLDACFDDNKKSREPGFPCVEANSTMLKVSHMRQPLRILDPVDQGQGGIVYRTNDPTILVKVSSEEPLCKEIALMHVLEGMDGLIPRIYTLDESSELSDWCHLHVVVMEKLGTMNWLDLPMDIPMSDQYIRFASFLRTLSKLHENGFLHGDLHLNNVRVNRADPYFVGLIDFGAAKPIERDPFGPKPIRHLSLMDEEADVNQAIPDDKLLKPAFTQYWNRLTDEEAPDFEYWINKYMQAGELLRSTARDSLSSPDSITGRNIMYQLWRLLNKDIDMPETTACDVVTMVPGRVAMPDGTTFYKDVEHKTYRMSTPIDFWQEVWRTKVATFLRRSNSIESVRLSPPTEIPLACQSTVFFDYKTSISLANISPNYRPGAARKIVLMLEKLHKIGIVFHQSYLTGIVFNRAFPPLEVLLVAPEKIRMYIDHVSGRHIDTDPTLTRKHDFETLLSALRANRKELEVEFLESLNDLENDLNQLAPFDTPNYKLWKDTLEVF